MKTKNQKSKIEDAVNEKVKSYLHDYGVKFTELSDGTLIFTKNSISSIRVIDIIRMSADTGLNFIRNGINYEVRKKKVKSITN